MSSIKLTLIATAIAASAQALAAGPVQVLNCRTGAGISFCRKLVEIQAYVASPCSGQAACYPLWNEQIKKVNVLVDDFDATFKSVTVVTPEALALVKLTTQGLCDRTYNVGLRNDWVNKIKANYVRFMRVSGWIQFLAKDQKPLTCLAKAQLSY